MKQALTYFLAASLMFISSAFAVENAPHLTLKDVRISSKYPWKKNINTTFFWIGQGSSSYSDTTNYQSAWDTSWTRNYGGVDHPEKRNSDEAGVISLPKKFAPTLNPFYVALPFNDVKYPELARKWVPWWDQKEWEKNRLSQCKGKWVIIEFKGRVAFAQWEDVGPLRYDHASYVFGNERPRLFSKAGLDVSPSVRDYLGLSGMDQTNWRFVDDEDVPYGPWIEYGEQAIVYSAIKSKTPGKKDRS